MKSLPGRRFWIPALLCSISLQHSVATAGTKNPKEIVKKVEKTYKQLKSLQADFTQEFKWELAGETQTVQGTLYLQDGNKYRIETDSQEIVTDGTTVWTFSKKSEQVIIDVLETSDENPMPKNLLFKYSEEYKPIFVAEEEIDGHKTYLLNLVPKDEEPFIKSMRIWVDTDDWFTRKIEQVDINDNVNTYMVANIQKNVKLDASIFSFEVLPGYEVVDMRAGQ